MKKEIWKDIKDYEGRYKVSNLGRVKSIPREVTGINNVTKLVKERILKTGTHSNGYLQVNLWKNNVGSSKLVHQLVAVAFLGHTPCRRKDVIDHIDHDKTNNTVDNLRILNVRENSSHRKKSGSSKYTGVCWHKRDKVWSSGIQINGKLKHLGYFDDEYDAHLAYQDELINQRLKLKVA